MKPIIYIDDEPMLCTVFARIFDESGHPVVTFTDPVAAIAYLAEHPAAAIICDYRMPAMSGLQLLDQVTTDAPFFLVSGDLAIEDRGAANPRVTGVLTKPFQPERLLELVLGAL